MAKVEYDGFAGWLRFDEAHRKPKDFAIEVITCHAALETEIDEVLKKLIPRAEFVLGQRPKLTFGQKIAVMRAVWPIEDVDRIDGLHAILLCYHNLRDAVAHHDAKAIDGCVEKLIQTAEAWVWMDNPDGDVPLRDIATSIILALDNVELAETLAAFRPIKLDLT